MQASSGLLNDTTPFSQRRYFLPCNESINTPEAEITREEWVEYFILYPDRLRDELPLLSAKEDHLDLIVTILKEVSNQADSPPRELITKYLSDGILSLSSDLKEVIIDEHSFFFADVVKFLSLEDRKEFLKAMTKELRDWKDLLRKVFDCLEWKDELKPFEDQPAGCFLSCLIGAFSSRRKKQWIKYCSRRLSDNNWAFFVLSLNGSDRALALRISTADLNFDLSKERYFSCFESLANQDHRSPEVKKILDQFLQKFYQAKQFESIVRAFTTFSDNTQVSLLNAMTSSKQTLIFSKYKNEGAQIALWYDQLLSRQTDLKKCRELTVNVFNALGEDNLFGFLQILNFLEFKGGAYLLAYLPIEVLQEFVITASVELRGELLVRSSLDSLSSMVLQTIKRDKERNSLIHQIMTFKMDDFDSFSTLEEFSNSLKNIDKNVAPDYADTVVLIPPILIGLLAASKKKRVPLLVVAPYMSEEQLNFFACHFDSSQFYDFTLKTGAFLTNNRFLALLHGLSPCKLLNYIKFKTEELRQVSEKFKDRYQLLLLNFNSLKNEIRLTPLCFEEFQKNVFELHSISKLPASVHYYYLWQFVQDEKNHKTFSREYRIDFQDAIGKLKKTMDSLTSKRPLFEGYHASMNLMLSELQNLVVGFDQEIDLTSVLYEGFWSFVREGNLPHLGISPHSRLGIASASQLTCLGIYNNEDLRYLGISVQLGKRVETLIRSIESLFMISVSESSREGNSLVKKKDPSKVWILWEECISLSLSDEIVRSKYEEIIDTLNLQEIKYPEFETIYLDLCGELLKFSHLSTDDKAFIERQCDVFKAQQEIKSLRKRKNRKVDPSQSEALLEALIILRKQHPLFCLQRYLMINIDLKQTWEILRSRGVSSINQLFVEKVIANPIDLLRLADFLGEGVIQIPTTCPISSNR